MTRDVVITGIGLLSSLGEGAEGHAALFTQPKLVVDEESFAPYPVHPMCVVNYDLQIPKKGDQRQMEPWQRIGVYAAGLALADAGLAGQSELLARTHMIVAAGGGERDIAVDEAVMSGIRSAPDKGIYLNERLMNDLRPTLFLAQLSNMLAGNISIVHGVTGSSRTFMGEEIAGSDTIRTLHARIASGQAELGLAGAAYNAERKDMLLLMSCGDLLLKKPYAPVWLRRGMIMGSMGAFLILEERAHAEKRGAKILARLISAATRRSTRKPGEARANLNILYGEIAPHLKGDANVLSCASGAAPVTGEEENFWHGKNANLRALGSLIGHGFEAQALFACAIGALSLRERRFVAPLEEKEKATVKIVEQIIVSCCGHWRGESLMLLEAA